MNAKDKETPLSKLKQYFRASKSSEGSFRERELVPELERELRPETPVAQRCKALKMLGDLVLTTRFEDASIRKLWDLTKDLIVDNKSTEYRHITLTFYRKLIQGQYENLSLMREHFFLVIQRHEVAEDLGHRLDLLKQLTDNGKNIKGFEEKIGQFMVEWAPAIVEGGLTITYLEMLVNIIKFNAAHLEDLIIVGILQNACHLSCNVDDAKVALQCLQVIDAVICYAILPNKMLPICIVTLCRTVNSEIYCQSSWRVMKNLLGTYSGYSSVLTMCSILNDRALYEDEALIRGAVFHITMGLWGLPTSTVPMLPRSPSSVLTSFLNSLKSQKIIVTYEVILGIKMFVRKCGKDMAEHTWDVVCDILFEIADNIIYYESNNIQKECKLLQQHFHEIIDIIEDMLREGFVCVNPQKVYDLIEKVAENRSEKSVMNLIDYRSSKITATRPHWLDALHNFVDRFYKLRDTKIRIKIVHCIMSIMDDNRTAYEEEILERVIIPHFSRVAQENDIHVRIAVAKALIEFASHCDTKRSIDILEILDKLLNRPFEQFSTKNVAIKNEQEIEDVVIVVQNLIDLFMIKLYRLPSNHAIKIFDILVGYIEKHYQRPNVFEHFNIIRLKIFAWMLNARANGTYHIGFPDANNPSYIRYSHYLGVDSALPSQSFNYQQSQTDNYTGGNFTTISIRRGCKTIITCLELERDFTVLKHVLKELPNILQNKILLHGYDIDSLANTLFKLFYDKKPIDYVGPYGKTTSDDFHALILPAIASLVIYHNLTSARQLTIINALKIGIPSKTAAVCINTLTIMILEMPETLMKQLPDVLLEMSKMSDTTSVAIPVLEFLSILSRLPNHLFANFVPRQYMYVFAISLPYTKPQRYDHYTVSLAYHVIAGWFLKCKLPLRKNFVKYIIASIQSNAHLPFEEDVNVSRGNFNPVNEDSTNRKRSSSLTERGSRGRDRPTIPPQAPNSNNKPLLNEKLKSFHLELAETCIDFIARHTFSPCSALPRRLPTAEYLLKDAPTQTWLVGHNLITITTSGCTTRPTRNGLCDHCAQQCKNTLQNLSQANTLSSNTESPEISVGPHRTEGFDFQQRRYAKVGFQYSSGTDSSSTDLTSSNSSSSQLQSQHSMNEGKSVRNNSNDGRFTSSSGSLEALSRRDSNPDSIETRETSVSSLLGNSLQQQTSQASQSTFSGHQQICACSCTGWAEIYIRRPTGCTSWIMRIQNPITNDCLSSDVPLSDLITLFLPSQHGGVLGPEFLSEVQANLSPSVVQPATILESKAVTAQSQEMKKIGVDKPKPVSKARSLKRQEEVTLSSTGPIDIPQQAKHQKDSTGSFNDLDPEEDDVSFEDGDSKSRNPVRRVNSSPEMSSNWRNPYNSTKSGTKSSENLPTNHTVTNASNATNVAANDKDDSLCVESDTQQKKKGFGKDMRVSCEAIPEEIAGSTPPSYTEFGNENEMLNKLATVDLKSSERESTTFLPLKQHSADDDVPTNTPIMQSSSTTSLKIPIDTQKIISKPPQSPIPLSPRLLAKNAAHKIASFAPPNMTGNVSDNGSTDKYRSRSKTISSVREMNRNTRPAVNFGASSTSRLTINPSFIFLQLYYTGQLQVTEMPIKVSPEIMKKISLLDLIPPFETHKIGVLYVGPGQCNNETEILRNRCGSVRYVEFLRNLGTLVSLKDAKENNLFINMESSGRDGNFTYVWKDDTVQVTFHVATLMPNKEQDPNCNEKKKHIGNNFVTIVYNESGEEYSLHTISSQFNYACVVVQPLELQSNRIFVLVKDDISKYIAHSEPKIVSDTSAPLLARQLALHADLASVVAQSPKTQNPYASNWLERLRSIKTIRKKLAEELKPMNSSDQGLDDGTSIQTNICDFSKYT